ncbi:hypothetical protein SAMN04488134_103114 [Amphibacillus marinus]|uniref:Uncharacterized protein n=1 Tax=Amphibacillus marinus TaxID=872970 RepID=A0A1H8L7S3_9BACI|nr:hypothetical protein [Amphibacillus marinus]SEO01175.1 hypothetical protein SAMN04488134_103114 [Amphibacillus marinus]
MQNRVKFKIGEIEFEAEGSAETIERERAVFMNKLLPAAVDAIVRTRGERQTKSNIGVVEQPATLLEIENKEDSYSISPAKDLSRTSLVSYSNGFGKLTEQDFVLIAAYYEENKNGIKSFSSENVKQYYSNARRKKYSNNSQLLNDLAQKGLIMDDSNAEKAHPKHYVLTSEGLEYVESYQPKEDSEVKSKATRQRKKLDRKSSTYASLSADDLKLKNYPEIKNQKTFKEKMILTLYIVTVEGKGEWFSNADVQCLMTDILGLSSSEKIISNIFYKNKSWFKSEQDPTNKKAYTHKLLQGAKDFAQSIIESVEK